MIIRAAAGFAAASLEDCASTATPGGVLSVVPATIRVHTVARKVRCVNVMSHITGTYCNAIHARCPNRAVQELLIAL
jgi:hypothetical protein